MSRVYVIITGPLPGRPTGTSFLRCLYDTQTCASIATDENVLGIAEFLEEYPSPTDPPAFMRKYLSDVADATFIVIQSTVDGTTRATQMKSLAWTSSTLRSWHIRSWWYSTALAEGRRARTTDSLPDSDTSSTRRAFLRRSPRHTTLIRLLSRRNMQCMCDHFAQLRARGVTDVSVFPDLPTRKDFCPKVQTCSTLGFLLTRILKGRCLQVVPLALDLK